QNVSDFIWHRLSEWGLKRVYGYPGDGVGSLDVALEKAKDVMEYVQVRHEEMAAFMASAHAKFTGQVGLCYATSGPGAIHLLNGLYDAKLDGQPVLAITGLQFHDLLDTFTQQDVELDKLYMDVCVYNARIMGPQHVQNVTELACRSALARRGVAHVTIPVDMQSQPVKRAPRSERNIPNHVSEMMARPANLANAEQMAKAAAILNSGKKIAILAGRGALAARQEVLAVAERLGAPIIKPLLGKGAVPDDSAYSLGGIGLLGTKPAQEALEACDTLLIAGSSFPYIEFYPRPGAARAVQIDIDAQRIGLRYPVEAGLVGDTGSVLRALLPELTRKEDRKFLDHAQADMGDWQKLMTERGTRTEMPMKPEVVAHELNKLLRDDAIVTTDSGTITTWIARHLMIRGEMMFSCSGNLATMACGLPYAIAAAVAHPGRQVVAFVGDGGLTMLLGELATCVKYGLDVKVVVIKNNVLGQIKWEQMVFLGNPEYVCELQPIDFATVARGFGVKGYVADDPKTCGDVLREALAAPGPALIEAVVDPHEPPMPPKATLKQVSNLARALAEGTPAANKIALTLASDVVREVV
ncbi:MAG TPA: thiamine pyrophosphate-dependent enzyme, partial [Devosia sp.]|nr:thiamine pyrophosphate-dependent enzyme [Devosia sp.]